MIIRSSAEAADFVRASLDASPLLSAVEEARAMLRARTRALTPKERSRLAQRGNVGIFGVPENTAFDDLTWLDRIRECEFVGSANQVYPGATLRRCTFDDCILDKDCTVVDCAHVERCVILHGTKAVGCGSLCGPLPAASPSCFGNTLVRVSPGPELGGRDVPCTAHLSLEAAARVAVDRSKSGVDMFEAASRDFASRVRFSRTILFGSNLSFAGTVEASCLIKARVTSGGIVLHSTMLEGSECSSNAIVEKSLLQPLASATRMGICRAALLCRDSHVELHGKVLSSILGPGGHLAEGEATSCLIGPLVGMHHQSLLIACLWPSGRGNIGYGANVGSNHTSRAPDQSLWPGEGVFFGLGSSNKFPLNLIEAPYTIVATGVVWGPGRLAFPWSLITQEGNGVRVAPGWGLEYNLYAFERAGLKASKKSPPGYAATPLRPAIVACVVRARDSLATLLSRVPAQQFFTDEPGVFLGGGRMHRKDAEIGFRAYENLLELYALRGAKHWGVNFEVAMDPALLDMDPADTGLADETLSRAHAMGVLKRVGAQDLEARLARAEAQYVDRVVSSKARDAERGDSVFPPGHYRAAMADLDADAVVMAAKARL